MKKIIDQYAQYNLWANQRITETINNLPDDKINMEIESSFSSIYKTLLHLWDVEYIWLQRLKLSGQQEWPGKTFSGSVMELSNNLLAQSKQWKEWVDVATEEAIQRELTYVNTKGDEFTQPIHEILVHVFNHQTFHRGQLITMMSQVGLTALPNTDLISFLRKK